MIDRPCHPECFGGCSAERSLLDSWCVISCLAMVRQSVCTDPENRRDHQAWGKDFRWSQRRVGGGGGVKSEWAEEQQQADSGRWLQPATSVWRGRRHEAGGVRRWVEPATSVWRRSWRAAGACRDRSKASREDEDDHDDNNYSPTSTPTTPRSVIYRLSVFQSHLSDQRGIWKLPTIAGWALKMNVTKCFGRDFPPGGEIHDFWWNFTVYEQMGKICSTFDYFDHEEYQDEDD